jgi:hypothetical protein
VACWLQTLDEGRPQEGSAPITKLPMTKEELFSYDAVLLLDPDPREFDEAWIELLTQFVGDHAGGLLYMAGPKYTTRLLTGPRTAPLAALLPVEFGDLAAGELATLTSGSTRAWPFVVVPANADHPVLRLRAGREQSLRQWGSLPGIFWSFRSQRARPTAEVLLEHSDVTLGAGSSARPLLVAGRYGAGLTLYLGFGDTWRWRSAQDNAELFDKFWIQTVRFLAGGRSLAGHRRGTLQADQERYELGDRVTVGARLLDASFQPLAVERIAATVEAADQTQEPIAFSPVANRPGTFEATWRAVQAGVHRVRLTLGDHDTGGEVIETSFQVDLPSAETSRVWLNRPLLRELASLSGGRYFEVHEIGSLPNAIPDRTQTVDSRGPPQPLWDSAGMLAVLVGLLCSEWILRKRFKLL